MASVYVTCARVTIFSTGGKFYPVLHVLTRAARSYALLAKVKLRSWTLMSWHVHTPSLPSNTYILPEPFPLPPPPHPRTHSFPIHTVHWSQQLWDSQEAPASQCIAMKEMLPILLSCAIWDKHWHRKHILFQSDNCPRHQELWGYLTDAHGPLLVCLPCTARHIPGIDNTLAGTLSCNNVTLFLSKVPNVDKTATHVPQKLMELLVVQKPELDIPELFSTILNKV